MTEHSDGERLRRLEDIESIKQLKARYFRTLDTKDWGQWGQVFTDDAVMEVPEADVVLNGRDHIVRFVSGALAEATTVHQGHMPEIEITGADRAQAMWPMFDFVEWPSSESGDRNGLTGYGHYIEQYRREDDGWRIAHTHLKRLRVDPLPSSS